MLPQGPFELPFTAGQGRRPAVILVPGAKFAKTRDIVNFMNFTRETARYQAAARPASRPKLTLPAPGPIPAAHLRESL